MPGSDEPIVNPSQEQMKESRLDLVLAGTDEAVLMIEGFCDFLTTDEMLRAIAKGHEAVSKACKEIDAWAQTVAPPKMNEKLIVPPEGVDEAVEAIVGAELAEAIIIPIKQVRGASIGAARERAVDALKDQYEVRLRCLAPSRELDCALPIRRNRFSREFVGCGSTASAYKNVNALNGRPAHLGFAAEYFWTRPLHALYIPGVDITREKLTMS